jgi:LEA14-like dessication related protein
MTRIVPLSRWLVLSLAVLLLNACAYLPTNVQEPRVHLVGLQLQSAELFEQRYRLKLRIQNPNDFALNIRGVDFRVDLNNERFAEGVSNQGVEVPGYGEAVMEVDVSSSLWSLARQLRDMGEREPKPIDYRLHGRLALEGRAATIGFESSGEIGFIEPRR